MHVSSKQHRLEIPESLRNQLFDFRRRLWAIKLAEAVCGAIFGVLLAFLVIFFLDRLLNTPAAVRIGIFLCAAAACSMIPFMVHRWIWRRRRLEQLAKQIGRRYPSIGDQILGIIELVRSEAEQARSMALCEAAITQVADQAESRDFQDAIPNPRHIHLALMATAVTALGIGVGTLYPAASANAWVRLLLPWSETPRFTFAKIAPLPESLVVPHGEPFLVTVRLAEDTIARPTRGIVELSGLTPIAASLHEDRYEFSLGPQIDSRNLDVRIGDFVGRLRLEPTLRPELNSLIADVELPTYLQRAERLTRDVRGGTVSLVNGSRATFMATASRELASAEFNGVEVTPVGSGVVSPSTAIDGDGELELHWEDELGLSGRKPFRLMIHGQADEAPSIVCGDLPRRKVVLDVEQLTFHVTAQDDFGVKQVGIEWRGLDDVNFEKPAQGERILSAGGPNREVLELIGTFSANSLGIEPQPLQVRLFADDYLVSRERVYSAPYLLYVLNAEQHAIWLTEQLSKWHRQSLDVRDRELQLYETNRELRALATDEIEQSETRRQIDQQASAERANGRRLNRLVSMGEDLVQQAMRNQEFGVGHLESWAEMLQVLKDISGNRMPSVADLLKQASQAPSAASSSQSKSSPQVGQIRALPSGKPAGDPAEAAPDKPSVPSIVDLESTLQPQDDDDEQKDESPSSSSGSPRLSLPSTTLLGAGKQEPQPSPASEKMEEAVEEQQDLLNEFEKIADELNRLLANLEGSTLVKRLKAASRRQYRIAGRLGEHVESTFGVALTATPEPERELLVDLSHQEVESSQDVSNIMDDMQAYFERRRFLQFKTVLDEMREEDVVGSLRQMADGVRKKSGLSMAQCEYWSDTLDRWAEDLVEPTPGGSSSGSKSAGSLPPSMVLDALQILEAEINLREETRVTEQARLAVTTGEFTARAEFLSTTQAEIGADVDDLVGRIEELPNADDFGAELQLLTTVSQVTQEATKILARPETGSTAIAAETDVIELLLQSKRINPNGGGGGSGSQPGGGGTGTTTDSAMSLIGSGINAKEVTEDHGISQSTGETGRELPEEFRTGLDEYFNRLEESFPGSQ